MKKLTYLFCGAILLAACNSSTNQTQTTDSTAVVTKTVTDTITTVVSKNCYLLVSGNTKRDTAAINLTLNGNEVEGTYSNSIWEKDSRKGTIHGTKQNDEIIGTWKFMQEGMTDSLPVQFKLEGDKLSAKDYSFDPKTGRQFIADTATYSRHFTTIDCKN